MQWIIIINDNNNNINSNKNNNNNNNNNKKEAFEKSLLNESFNRYQMTFLAGVAKCMKKLQNSHRQVC